MNVVIAGTIYGWYNNEAEGIRFKNCTDEDLTHLMRIAKNNGYEIEVSFDVEE